MRALYLIKKKIFSYYTSAKRPSTTFLYLWGSFTTTSTFLSLSSSNTAFLLFSIQHHLKPHFIVPPPPPHTHTHAHYQHISIVFRPQPQHMYFFCFPSTIFTTTSFLFVFILSLQHISMVSHPLHSPHFYCFPAPLPPPHSYCFPSTTTTTFLLFFLHHLHHISIVFLFPLQQYQISKLPPPAPPPSNFYVFFISMLTHQNEEKNRFGQRRAREWK